MKRNIGVLELSTRSVPGHFGGVMAVGPGRRPGPISVFRVSGAPIVVALGMGQAAAHCWTFQVGPCWLGL